jgi:PGF-pre-PGF domain-containing protein/uncharacterized repeat protein (TIGR02543 family)
MIIKKQLLKKVSSTLFVSAMIVLMFTSMSSSAEVNYYDETNHSMNIVSFDTGSLSVNVTAEHSTLADITTLRITNGTLNSVDVYWIRNNLVNLETFEVIEDGAFVGNAVPSMAFGSFNFVNVTLTTVTTIGDSAFSDCSSLEYVNLPMVEIIGENSFGNCGKLSTIIAPNVTTIGNDAFWSSKLETIDMPELFYIGEGAFFRCYQLVSVNIPNVGSIGESAFGYCNNLTDVYMPNVISIGAQAFQECTGLTSISLPNLTSVEGSVFKGCNNLASVYLPNVTRIEGNAFQGCSQLDSLTLGSTVPTVYDAEVFAGLPATRKLYVPNEAIPFYKEYNDGDDPASDLWYGWTVHGMNELFYVTYNPNGATDGNVPTDELSYISGESVTVLGQSDLLKTGHAFSGWNTLANGNGANHIQNDTFTITGNTTLYANWTAIYSVTYHANSATSGDVPVDSTVYYQDDEVTILDQNTLVRTGYVFAGWDTAADGNGESCSPGDKFNIYNDVALYAQWDKVKESSSGSSGRRYVAGPSDDLSNVESSATSTLRVYAGVKANYDFSASESPVLGVSFEPMQNKGTVEARVHVLSEKPSNVVESSAKSYVMMDIVVGSQGTISSTNAKDITISFKVTKQWIEENNIDISTIRLSRYHDDQWNDLLTILENEDDEYIYFSATTPGFSVFEIKGDSISITDDEVDQPSEDVVEPFEDVATTENGKDKNTGYISLILGSLAIIGTAGYIYWTKQNKGGKQ